MREYENYRESNVAWLGAIPAHWGEGKIDSLFIERKTKVSDKNYLPLSVTQLGVLPQLETAAKSNDSDNRKLVCVDDFVINSRSDRKGSCGVSAFIGSVSLINIVLTPRSSLHNKYVHYLLRCNPFSEEYYRNGRGIVADLWTTRYSEMKSIFLPVPPIEEQEQIAKFLDGEISQIDKLILTRKYEIMDFEDLKKVAISRAVTRGLNPDAPLRDSGVQWLGEIPSDWIVGNAKRFVRITNGVRPTTEGDIPVYGSGKNPFATCGEYKIGPTVLLGRKGSIDNPTYIEGLYWNVDTAFDVKPLRDDLSIKYYYYLAICFDYGFYMTQTAIPSMTQTDYYDMYIPVPPLNEQKQIAEYLDRLCSKIDSLISNYTLQIETLNELKARLIYDAVTGKIDVRNITIPKQEGTQR